MGEIKSVKVDNWGVFFLQKLQNFFNKTDYCDLTLQFHDNSQLKVHRLVLSACTDYFNVLEQTCEMIDDALIMPNELQADVVVPIVNFMYTGTLEFELKMYGKLLRTAKDMNMTVLLKLLEAHRRTMEGVNRMQRPPSPKPLRRRLPTNTHRQTQLPAIQQRSLLTSANSVTGAGQRRVVQTKTISTTSTTPPQYRQQIGSTSLIRTGNAIKQESQQTDIKQEPEEPTATSPFEQLRKGYNNNKRPSSTTLMSPPTKKLNIEDVKEFAEQQRMRKQIAAEYGEDHGTEYESNMMEDDIIHNDDDDDDLATTSANATTYRQQTQMQQGTTTITINQNEKPPTIVVKDSSNSKMNHAKIIKEVLRQYPHLVKSNKNIKLKIMPSSGDQPQKIIVKKEQLENISSSDQLNQTQTSVLRTQTSQQQTLLKPMEKAQQQAGSALKLKSPTTQQNTSPRAITTAGIKKEIVGTAEVGANSSNAGATAPSIAPPAGAQKRRIDSKTMHALIALGAENTSGPWLCLRCGVNGRPISIPSYRGFRRHLINTHKEYIDPALCEHCGWRSSNKRELHFHMEMEHKIKTTSFTFPQCLLCSIPFLDTNTLNQHMVDAHPDENKQQCIYCNKIFARELQLYNHMKTYHKKQALEDGIIDYSDEEEEFGEVPHSNIGELIPSSQGQTSTKEKKESKIKILSDISLPSAGSILKLEGGSICPDINTQIHIAGANNHQQSYVETSEAAIVATTESPKFVNVDGNEMVLTDEQRQEIMAQLNQEHGSGGGGSGVVMVLNEPAEVYTTDTNSTITKTATLNTAVVESGEERPHTQSQLTEESEQDAEANTEDEVMEEDGDMGNAATVAESSTGAQELVDGQVYNDLNDDPTEAATAGASTTEEKKDDSSVLDESKGSMENLAWAENLISAHEMADQQFDENKKDNENKHDDLINQKLKELTGDWSEDENEDEHDEEMEITNTSRVELNIAPATASPAFSSTSMRNLPEDQSKYNVGDNEKEDEANEEKNSAEERVEKSIEQIEALTEISETKSVDTADNPVLPEANDAVEADYTTNTHEPKCDGDDLDTLMHDLHKDDSGLAVCKTETESENEFLELKKEDIVQDSKKTTEGKEKSDTQILEKSLPTQECGNIGEKDCGKECADVSVLAPDHIMSLERDVLLDELIGGSNGDFNTDTARVETKPTDAELSTAKETVVEAMEVDDEANNEEEVKSEDTDTNKVTTIPAADETIDKAITKNADENVKDVTTVAIISDKNPDTEVDAAKTSERVKSLISEWGEDEDEDEDEQQDASTKVAERVVDEEQL